MKPVRTWIVIADSGRAHVLEAVGKGHGARRIDGLDLATQLPRTHDIVTDRQARSFEATGETRHPITPKTDPRMQLKESFLEQVASMLDERLAAGAYDRVVLVAPPHALGVLRQAISDKVKAVVAGELAKDLTKTPEHELPNHLSELVSL